MQGLQPILAGATLALPGLLLAPAVVAQEKQVSSKATVEAVEELEQEFKTSYDAWLQELRSASKAERQKLYEKRPQPSSWFPKFWEIVDAEPKSEAAAAAATWIVTRASMNEPKLKKSLGVLLAHHIENPKMEKVCSKLGRAPTLTAASFLKQVATKNPNAKVQGLAYFNLAESLKSRAKMARTLKNADEKTQESYVSYLGKETFDVVKNADSAKLELEAEKLYEKVLTTAEYADLEHYRGSLGKAAKANLFEMRNLGIGKTAPDIVGEDIDGNAMKLSDYRGKVVVLDFWGDW